MFRGTSEPMLLGAALWAVDRHLAGRHREAFLLGVAAALIRPEAWPFIGLYAIWLWRRERAPGDSVLLLLGLAAIPVLWFGPAVGRLRPAVAGRLARQGLQRAPRQQTRSWRCCAAGPTSRSCRCSCSRLVAVAIGWWRERDRLSSGWRWRARLVGPRRGDDARRLSRARALLPARGRDRPACWRGSGSSSLAALRSAAMRVALAGVRVRSVGAGRRGRWCCWPSRSRSPSTASTRPAPSRPSPTRP